MDNPTLEQGVQTQTDVDKLKNQRIYQQDIVPSAIKPRHLVSSTGSSKGSVYYSDGTNFVSLAPGSTGQALQVSNGLPTWQNIPTQTFTQLNDTNGNPVIETSAATGPVNQFTAANAASGSAPTLSVTGTNTNIPLVLASRGSALVKLTALEQDIAANSYNPNTVFLSGWSFITGDGATANFTKAITFGITFTTIPIILTSFLGSKTTSDPTSIGDFTATLTNLAYPTGAVSITTSGFTASLPFTSAPSSGLRIGFSWIAIGTQ